MAKQTSEIRYHGCKKMQQLNRSNFIFYYVYVRILWQILYVHIYIYICISMVPYHLSDANLSEFQNYFQVSRLPD